MKIAIDSYCYHRYFGEVYDNQENPDRSMTVEDFLKRAIELDVDGVSLETCFLQSTDESYLQRLRGILHQGKLEPVVAWGHPDGLEGGKNVAALHDMKRHFKTCEQLNAKVMRIVGSSLAFRHEPHGPQIERLSKLLKEPAQMAEGLGIKLAMENHFDFTTDEILEILTNVASDCLGVTFDTGNALRICENPVEAAQKLVKHIYATHVKDLAPLYGGNPQDWYFFASVPLGRGIVDIPSIVTVLEEAGYEGLCTIEIDYLHPDYDDEDPSVGESVNYLRKIGKSAA